MEKPCIICGQSFAKKPSHSKTAWAGQRTCSRECGNALKRGRPNPKVSAALRGRVQPPEVVARRAEGLRRAHAEGRMPYGHFRGLSGDQTSQWKGDEVGYRALHSRLVKQRGKASDQPCVDCGDPAKDWSHDAGAGAFTTNLDDYSPRCRRCHLVYDERERDECGRLI